MELGFLSPKWLNHKTPNSFTCCDVDEAKDAEAE